MKAEEEIPIVIDKEEAVNIIQSVVGLSRRHIAEGGFGLHGTARRPRHVFFPQLRRLQALPLMVFSVLICRFFRNIVLRGLREKKLRYEVMHYLPDGGLILLLDRRLPFDIIADERCCVFQNLLVFVDKDKMRLVCGRTSPLRMLLLML